MVVVVVMVASSEFPESVLGFTISNQVRQSCTLEDFGGADRVRILANLSSGCLGFSCLAVMGGSSIGFTWEVAAGVKWNRLFSGLVPYDNLRPTVLPIAYLKPQFMKKHKKSRVGMG